MIHYKLKKKETMNRISLLAFILLTSFAANAQTVEEDSKTIIDREFMRELLTNCGVLLGLFLVTAFFLSMMRTYLDSRLKNRLIDKGASESVVTQLLQPMKNESKLEPLKWFSILAGIGLGLALIDAFKPLGIHSLAIMAFSLAAGFLCYYFLSKRTEK
jgi:hypothetical protein